MRTTVTIEDDLAVLLESRRRETGMSFKQALNGALRDGLVSDTPSRQGTREPFHTPTFHLGEPLVDNIDNSGEVLSYLDVVDGYTSA